MRNRILCSHSSAVVGSTIEHPRWAPVAGVKLLPLSFGIMSGAAAHSNNDHQSKKRAVVVYARAGEGHLAAAQTLQRILEGDPNIEVLLRDGETLDSDTPGPGSVVELWNLLIRKGWFRLADWIFNHWLRVLGFPLLAITAGEKVKAHLKALRPDAVLSTADIYNRALGDAATDLAVPFTVMPVEFSIFADLLHPAAEYLCSFEETARAIRRFDLSAPYFRNSIPDGTSWMNRLRYFANWVQFYGVMRTEPLLFQRAGNTAPGTNGLACHVIGPLRRPEDHAPAGDPPPGERPRILVVSGSLGGRFVVSVVRRLCASSDLVADVVAICGRDEAAIAELSALTSSRSSPVRVECLGFAADLPDRFRKASVMIARPSATVFLEVILAGLPLLIPARATRNDMGTVELLEAWRIGETYRSEYEIPSILAAMLPRLGEYRERIRGIRSRQHDTLETVSQRRRAVTWRSVRTP
jgi:hypothetical protein